MIEQGCVGNIFTNEALANWSWVRWYNWDTADCTVVSSHLSETAINNSYSCIKYNLFSSNVRIGVSKCGEVNGAKLSLTRYDWRHNNALRQEIWSSVFGFKREKTQLNKAVGLFPLRTLTDVWMIESEVWWKFKVWSTCLRDLKHNKACRYVYYPANAWWIPSVYCGCIQSNYW